MLDKLTAFLGLPPTREQTLAKEAELLKTIPELVANSRVIISKFGEINVDQHVDFEHYIHISQLETPSV